MSFLIQRGEAGNPSKYRNIMMILVIIMYGFVKALHVLYLTQGYSVRARKGEQLYKRMCHI